MSLNVRVSITRGQELIAVTAQRAPPLILVRLYSFDNGHVGRVDEGVKRVIGPDGPGAVGVGGDPFELDFGAAVRLHLLPSLADWIEQGTRRRLMLSVGRPTDRPSHDVRRYDGRPVGSVRRLGRYVGWVGTSVG